jgi:hypothetical protein
LALFVPRFKLLLVLFEKECSAPGTVSEVLDGPLGELLSILETSAPLDKLYRARAAQAKADFFRQHHSLLVYHAAGLRDWLDTGKLLNEIGELFRKLLDDRWRERLKRFIEETADPLGQGFSVSWKNQERRILRILAPYVICVFDAFINIPYPFQEDLATWRSETVEQLCACYVVLLRGLLAWTIRDGRDFSAWILRVKDWEQQVERTGVELAGLRHAHRKVFAHYLVPEERIEDRLLDYLVAKQETRVIEALGLSRSELTRRVDAALPDTQGGSATSTATSDASGSAEGERGFEALVVLDPVSELRKRGSPKQAALVEYLLKNSGKAEFDDVKDHVHGNKSVTDAAVRKRVSETHKSLVEIGSRLIICTASGFVYLDDPPE